MCRCVTLRVLYGPVFWGLLRRTDQYLATPGGVDGDFSPTHFIRLLPPRLALKRQGGLGIGAP